MLTSNKQSKISSMIELIIRIRICAKQIQGRHRVRVNKRNTIHVCNVILISYSYYYGNRFGTMMAKGDEAMFK